jgi:starch synthase
VVYSIYDDAFKGSLRSGFEKKMKLPGITLKDLKYYKDASYVNLTKAAIDYSDGIIIGSPEINPEIAEYLKTCNKPVLEYQGPEQYADAYNTLYDTLLNNN